MPSGNLIGYAIKVESLGSLPTSGPSLPTPTFDHTYVRSSQGDAWGCYGRDDGGTEICSGGSVGDIRQARCLAQPSGTAGIIYAITGVCHQSSNRILWPAGVRVEAARGYAVSCLKYGFYGDIGTWAAYQLRCKFGIFNDAGALDHEPTGDAAFPAPVAQSIRDFYNSVDGTKRGWVNAESALLATSFLGERDDPVKMARMIENRATLLDQHDALVRVYDDGRIPFAELLARSETQLENTLQEFERLMGQEAYGEVFHYTPNKASRIFDRQTPDPNPSPV